VEKGGGGRVPAQPEPKNSATRASTRQRKRKGKQRRGARRKQRERGLQKERKKKLTGLPLKEDVVTWVNRSSLEAPTITILSGTEGRRGIKSPFGEQR